MVSVAHKARGWVIDHSGTKVISSARMDHTGTKMDHIGTRMDLTGTIHERVGWNRIFDPCRSP